MRMQVLLLHGHVQWVQLQLLRQYFLQIWILSFCCFLTRLDMRRTTSPVTGLGNGSLDCQIGQTGPGRLTVHERDGGSYAMIVL